MSLSDLVLPTIMAALIWVALFLRKENRRLLVETTIKDQEREAVLTFLNRIGEAFTRELNLDETLSMIGEFIVEETLAESGAIYLFDAAEEYLHAKVVVGLFPPLHETLGYVLTKKRYVQEKVKSERIRRGESIIGVAAETGEPYLITDASTDSRVPESTRSLVKMQSLMVAPLRVRGKVLGVMAVVNKTVGNSFDARDMGLLTTLADQAANTVNIVSLYSEIGEKQRMEQELLLAQEFQRLLLPKDNPHLEYFEISGISTPALEVGGDYFDYIPIDEEHLGLCIADVSGKGIPGGLVMAAVRSTLRAEARMSLSPREVMMAVNSQILKDTKENVFITMTFGVLNLRTGAFTFVRAGHEPTILLDSEGALAPRLVSPEGIALGLVDNEIFSVMEEQTVTLGVGETAVLYTDGVVEAMNEKSEEYGSERFLKCLQRNAYQKCEALIEALSRDIERFSGGIAQHDDITMLVIRRRGRAMSGGPAKGAGEASAEAAVEKIEAAMQEAAPPPISEGGEGADDERDAGAGA
jgi:sigma-B regulation protein RsbU (phosphoserine phosphatase)